MTGDLPTMLQSTASYSSYVPGEERSLQAQTFAALAA